MSSGRGEPSKRLDPKKRDEQGLLGKDQTQRRRERADEQRQLKREGAIAKRRRASPPLPEEAEGPAAATEWSEEELKWALTGVMELPKGQVLPHLRKLRELLSLVDPPIQETLDAGVLPHLANLLIMADESLALDAVWCLTNIATGSTEQTRPVLDCAPHLLALLDGGNPALQEQALWAIGNIAADENADYRAALLANGAALPVVRLLSTASAVVAHTAAWALSNLARGYATSARVFAEAGAFPALLPLLASPDDSLAVEAAWALTFLTAREEEYVDQLVALGVTPLLVALLQRSGGSDPLATPALRALGNLSSGKDSWMAAVLAQPGCLPALLVVLQADVTGSGRPLAKEAAWVASNLASGGPAVRDALAAAGIVDRLLALLQCGQFDVQREALMAVWNLAADGRMLPRLAAAPGVVPAVVALLRVPDALAVKAALSLLRLVCERVDGGPQLVERLGGLEAIDDLHYGRVDESLSSAAAEIVDRFFGEDYQGGEELPPPSSEPFHPAGTGLGRGKHVNVPAWMQTAK